MKKLYAMLFVLLLSAAISGCNSKAEDTIPTETTQYTTQQTQVTTVPSIAETAPESETYELTTEYDRTKLCLRFQPTRDTTSGEDARYFTPIQQDKWISAFETALDKADTDAHWEPGDSSMGIWIRYQDHWWELLTRGEILTLGSGRISAADAAALYEMSMEAAEALNMEEPVRPSQIKNIKSATLDWNGTHTITDPQKLKTLEGWLSNSIELHGGANCWFTALLSLTLDNGDVLTLSMATDSCCSWLSEGVFYDYGSFDNAKFYELFTGENREEEISEETQPDLQAYTLKADDFVRIIDYIPEVDVALAYATTNNFTQQTIYDFSDAYLRYGTLQKLILVAEELNEQNLTLRIWDAYRPISGQARLWEACPDPTYVSPPDTGNRTHCRGSAVDVTLLDLDGNELEMPSGFDDFSAKGDRDYADCSETAAAYAGLLQEIMEKHGFKGYSGEWWHFTDQDTYPIEETFQPVEESWYYADCNEYISLRCKPSTAAETLLRIPADDQLLVLAHTGDFAFVSYNGMNGYVLRSYIQPVQ